MTETEVTVKTSPFAIKFPPRPTGEIEIVNDIGQVIALVLPTREEGIRETQGENALLFGASSALYEALKDLVQAAGNQPEDVFYSEPLRTARRKALSALGLAEGRQSQ